MPSAASSSAASNASQPRRGGWPQSLEPHPDAPPPPPPLPPPPLPSLPCSQPAAPPAAAAGCGTAKSARRSAASAVDTDQNGARPSHVCSVCSASSRLEGGRAGGIAYAHTPRRTTSTRAGDVDGAPAPVDATCAVSPPPPLLPPLPLPPLLPQPVAVPAAAAALPQSLVERRAWLRGCGGRGRGAGACTCSSSDAHLAVQAGMRGAAWLRRLMRGAVNNDRNEHLYGSAG
eukprot:363345-Chlamydomonas_euryale.AAC.5